MNILIALLLGVIVGHFLNLGHSGKKINGKLQQLGVIFLLFSMGTSIGADSEIIKNLATIGLKSLLFAIATIGFSIALVYILSEKFMTKENRFLNTHEMSSEDEDILTVSNELLDVECEER